MARYLKKSSFPITLVVLLLGAIFTFRGEAQQNKTAGAVSAQRQALKPQVAYPVASGTSVAARDLPAAADLDVTTMEDFERRVLNTLNTVEMDRVPRAGVVSFDAAIAGGPNRTNG